MSSFELHWSEQTLRIDASGERVIDPENGDALDRMLYPLGVLQVAKCPHCASPAHMAFMPERERYRQLSSYWHCHGCGCEIRMFVGIFDHKLPKQSYDVPGVRSTSN